MIGTSRLKDNVAGQCILFPPHYPGVGVGLRAWLDAPSPVLSAAQSGGAVYGEEALGL